MLLSVEDQFVPALSTEIVLYDYSKKLHSHANCLITESENEILAFLFYYITDKTESVLYITLICSIKPGEGQKIYRELLNCMNPKIVKLEVDKENKKAISFYKNLGFVVDQIAHTRNKLHLKHCLR